MKAAPTLPHAAIGAAMGAAGGLAESRMSNEPLRQKIEALQAQPDLDAKDTANLAQLQLRHTLGEYAHRHPVSSMGMGALAGGMFGASQGPGIVDAVREGRGLASDIGKNVKDFFARGAA